MNERIEMMPTGRSCRYVVVKFGYLNRGEHMNIGVLLWEHDVGLDTPVYQKLIDNWDHIVRAFPGSGADTWVKDSVISALSEIRTLWDYIKLLTRMGPYTPFEFTQEKPSIAVPEQALKSLADFFLAPYTSQPGLIA
jgi:hypothetical protein